MTDNNKISISIPTKDEGLSQTNTGVVEKKKSKAGRPRKADIEAKKQGNRGAVGRPKGDAHRIQELKARLLATTGNKVINKIVSIAMDDNHSGQMAALKMCMDRVLPTSLFEKDAKGQRNAVTINITGIGEAKIEQAEVVDGEFTDVEFNDAA